jgi:hypothetical protein
MVQVTCTFLADDFVDEVFYNGESIRGRVSNVNGQSQDKTATFEYVPGAVLAIACRDNQPGTAACFCFHCESNDATAPWNFFLTPENGSLYCKAYGKAGPEDQHLAFMDRPIDRTPPNGWEQNDFDDSLWGQPDRHVWDGWHSYSQKLRTKGAIGVWYQKKKYTFYRISPDAEATRLWEAPTVTLLARILCNGEESSGVQVADLTGEVVFESTAMDIREVHRWPQGKALLDELAGSTSHAKFDVVRVADQRTILHYPLMGSPKDLSLMRPSAQVTGCYRCGGGAVQVYCCNLCPCTDYICGVCCICGVCICCPIAYAYAANRYFNGQTNDALYTYFQVEDANHLEVGFGGPCDLTNAPTRCKCERTVCCALGCGNNRSWINEEEAHFTRCLANWANNRIVTSSVRSIDSQPEVVATSAVVPISCHG